MLCKTHKHSNLCCIYFRMQAASGNLYLVPTAPDTNAAALAKRAPQAAQGGQQDDIASSHKQAATYVSMPSITSMASLYAVRTVFVFPVCMWRLCISLQPVASHVCTDQLPVRARPGCIGMHCRNTRLSTVRVSAMLPTTCLAVPIML